MAEPEIVLDEKSVRGFQRAMSQYPERAVVMLAEVLDAGGEMIKNHAQGDHFFVGTSKKARKEGTAEANVFTFTNPDGTPRFKVHTNVLRRSIQTGTVSMDKGGPYKEIRAGAEYARQVEEGGPGRRAFPFMKPAFEYARPLIVRMARKGLKTLIGG